MRYRVTCVVQSQGRAWKHEISWHDSRLDAVVAASQYRNLFQRTFGHGNVHDRRWVVERIGTVERPATGTRLVVADGDD